jgi:glycosyltransferase involved in cell wall biosynthesis
MGGTTRVLFVNPGLAMGGAEQSLLLLLEGLRAHGLEATVALFGEGPFRDRLSALGFSIVCVAPPGVVRRMTRYGPGASLQAAALGVAGIPTAVRLAALARRIRADLIHTNGLKAHLLAGVAGRMIDTPVVWHLRDFPPGGLVGLALRVAARRLPALVLTNSDAVAVAIRRDGIGVPPVKRLYNPVDLCRFHPSLPRGRIRRELGLGEDVPLVGLVAHMTPWKGHDVFLSIGRAVAQAVPGTYFVVVGGPIYETDGHAGYSEVLRRRAVELGVAEKVAFLGARDDMPDVLADLDVLVHCPTAPEPFGRVLAEAMAVGRTVVAAGLGGIPEVVQDGVTGLLVPLIDVNSFASAVIRLLQEPALRDRLGKSGRLRAEALFGLDAHTEGVLKAYESVLAAGKSTA